MFLPYSLFIANSSNSGQRCNTLKLLQRKTSTIIAIDHHNQVVTIKGKERDAEAALQEIERLKTNFEMESTTATTKIGKQSGIFSCVYCKDAPVTRQYTLGLCGHRYCVECLRNHLILCSRNRAFPVTCAEENCGQPILLEDIERRTTVQDCEVLLTAAVFHFVDNRPESYIRCKTSRCPGVVERKPWQSVFLCPHCSKLTCAACSYPARLHEGFDDCPFLAH